MIWVLTGQNLNGEPGSEGISIASVLPLGHTSLEMFLNILETVATLQIRVSYYLSLTI